MAAAAPSVNLRAASRWDDASSRSGPAASAISSTSATASASRARPAFWPQASLLRVVLGTSKARSSWRAAASLSESFWAVSLLRHFQLLQGRVTLFLLARLDLGDRGPLLLI